MHKFIHIHAIHCNYINTLLTTKQHLTIVVNNEQRTSIQSSSSSNKGAPLLIEQYRTKYCYA